MFFVKKLLTRVKCGDIVHLTINVKFVYEKRGEKNVIKKMQYFAYSLVPWAVVSMISDSIRESILNNKLSVMFSIDLGVVLIVLVVLLLVHIFKYGAVLQQESDETL